MSGPVSENGRPSLDTEAVSPEASYGEIKVCLAPRNEIKQTIKQKQTNKILQVDASMLDPSCLVPPTIPNTLGAEDIDKVQQLVNLESKQTNKQTNTIPNPLGAEDIDKVQLSFLLRMYAYIYESLNLG